MKVSIARIRLYLKEGKTLADGSHPIMLMCSFNGRKEVSSGYSCDVKHWDKKSEMVKKGYPNFVMINHHLKELKDGAIAKRDSYIAKGEVYTPQMILAKEEVRNAVTNDFRGLIEQYIVEKGLEDKTIEKWRIVQRNVIRFAQRDILVNEVDESFCRRYGRWLEDKGMVSGSIKSYLGKIGAICHFAISKGLIDVYPLENWKYHKDYRESKNELYIHSRSMEVMIDMFLDEVIVRGENGMWHYRDGVIDKLLDIHSEIYSHYLYIIGFYLCGLAPVDISLYKRKDIKVRDVNGNSYYYFNGHRSKTGMEYRFYIPFGSVESNVLIKTMLMFNNGTEYFLPSLKGYVGKDIKKRVNNLYTYHGDNLVNWFQKVNERIIQLNMDNDDNIELIDLECRYYSYRHSRIMAEIQKKDVNLLKIATITGKSVKTIHQYVTLLGEADLV